MSRHAPRPKPQGRYLSAVRHGDLIYTSGFTPREDGKLLYAGAMRADAPENLDAIRLATQNAVWAVQACLRDGEKVDRILQLNVFLNVELGFTSHSKLADVASDQLLEEFGAASIGSRTALGTASLPSDASVEINLTAAVTGQHGPT